MDSDFVQALLAMRLNKAVNDVSHKFSQILFGA
jgi:hypothetical protein